MEPMRRIVDDVLSLAPAVDAQRGAVEVKFALEPPAPGFLREDMTLSVEDETGRRSDPNCGAVATLLETRARLSFRYRGWWYEPSDWCLDVPWAND